MKKKIILIFMSVFLCIVFMTSIFIRIQNAYIWKWSAAFDKYSMDFNLVKEYFESNYQGENEKTFFLGLDEEKKVFIFFYEEGRVEPLSIPDDVYWTIDSLRNNAFPNKDSNFDYINVTKDRISFGIDYYQYELVYSPQNTPTWINPFSKEENIKVRNAGDGWYHVILDN